MKMTQIISLLLRTTAFGAGLLAQETNHGAVTQQVMGAGAAAATTESQATKPIPARVSLHRRRKAERAFQSGAKAIERGDARSAERDFEIAHDLDLENQRYSLSVEIARQYLIPGVAQHADTEWSVGHKEDAFALPEDALRGDSNRSAVNDSIEGLAAKSREKPAAALHADSHEAAAPIEVTAQDGKHSFHLHDGKRSVIPQVLSAFGIRAVVDQSVNAQNLRFDADEIDFAEAEDLLNLATRTLFVPLDSKTVLAVADTQDNRAKYQRLVTRTFYLSGLNSRELTDMWNIARNVFGAERSLMEPLKGTLTVRAPAPVMDALDQTYSELLQGRSVLELDLNLYEIDKTRTTNVGISLPSSTTVFNVPSEVNSILQNNSSLVNQIIAEYPSLAGNDEAILAALIASGLLTGTVFNSPLALFGGGLTETGLDLSGLNVNLLLNSSDARSLKQIQVRVLDQEETTVRSGERYPIMTSSFSSLTPSSSSSSTTPQFQYEDLGLTLKMTPRVEFSGRVSLNLDMKLSSLAGTSLNDIPILANRQYSGIVSLRLGDSAILVSDMSQQESRDITGVPGLSDIPGLSGTTNQQRTKDLMELAIVITPHLIRSAYQEDGGSMFLLPRY
jgi:hypothetical protein